MKKPIAKNCCRNCRYELTCGYSPLAARGAREARSYGPCMLGNMSYSEKPFFEIGKTARIKNKENEERVKRALQKAAYCLGIDKRQREPGPVSTEKSIVGADYAKGEGE